MNNFDFYNYFLDFLQEENLDERTVDEIIEHSKLHKSQVHEWLKIAISEGKIQKLNKPIRYKLL